MKDTPMDTALLLIDLQNDYFEGGAMTLDGADAAVANAARLLDRFRARGWPIVHVQHLSTRPGATFFLPGTRGAEIHATVSPNDGETVIVKHFPNAFRETPLVATLRGRGIAKLTIAGMMTHMCVDTSTRAAADMGFACTLAHDACATRTQAFDGRSVAAADVQAAYMAALNGAFARVVPTGEIVAAG
jgi:nicotinamidase-related amidase